MGEEEQEPREGWRIVSSETLAWIRSTMNHQGLRTLEPGCICGLNKDEGTVKRREGYSHHAQPTGFCHRHQKGVQND